MSKHIVVLEPTYNKLKFLNKQIGRNYSMNTLINELVMNWVTNEPDDKYQEKMLRELATETLIKAKEEKLISVISPEIQTLLYLILSGKLYAAQVYLNSFFSGVIKAQKKEV